MRAQIASDTAPAVILNDEIEQDFELESAFDGEDLDDEGEGLEPAALAVAAPRENPEARAKRIAAGLPDDADQLIATARETLQAYDLAIRSDDPAAAEIAEATYEAVVWKLNGGTFFASQDGEESAAVRVRNLTAAEPGKAPLWGQRGEWLMDVSGIRVLVRCEGGFGIMGHHYEFFVVDLAKPFVSETGYRSNFGKPIYEATVEQAVTVWLNGLIRANKKPVLVQPKHREFAARYAARCAWLNASGAAESKPIYEEASGQFALAL